MTHLIWTFYHLHIIWNQHIKDTVSFESYITDWVELWLESAPVWINSDFAKQPDWWDFKSALSFPGGFDCRLLRLEEEEERNNWELQFMVAAHWSSEEAAGAKV